MKKRLVLLILLLFLALLSLCLIGASVQQEKDRITITEQARFGDPSLARHATLSLSAQMNEHQLWNMTYPIGGVPTTEYRFSAKELEFEHKVTYNGIQLYEDIPFGYDLRTSPEETTGIQRAYRELYDATAPGTKGTKIVRLQDYYEYYPIRMEIDLPGTLWHTVNYDDLDERDDINQRKVWDAFREFFKIPIPENLPAFEISITKDESGKEIGIGSSSPAKYEDGYALYSEATYTSNACFFTLNNRMGDGYVDTSLIPGGYGIYRFSYTKVRNEQNTKGNVTIFHPGYLTGVDADSLVMVYPLEQHIQVRAMFVNPEETRLLLLTDEKNGVYLTVIDIATMTELQKFRITDNAHVSLNQQDDFIILFYEQKFSVFSVDEHGLYTPAITADQPVMTDDTFAHINTYSAMDFDGTYLVMADVLPSEHYYALQTCHFCLAVYDRTGLRYYGEYQNSLSVNPDTNYYHCNVIPFEIAVHLNS